MSGFAANSGTVLLGDPLATFGGGSGTTNTGTIRGSGLLVGPVNNSIFGRIEVTEGDDLRLTGSLTNDAAVDVIGGNFRVEGTASTVPATGIITARNALLSFGSGLDNDGALVIAGGVNDVFGDINNTAVGRVIVSGGATAIFYDDVNNTGNFNVSAAGLITSIAVFFGELIGNGIAGAGSVFIEGDARPGFSPGIMNFGGQVSFGPAATLHAELGGTVPGTDYDQLRVDGGLTLGGTLAVTLSPGFVPTAGMSFDLWNAGSVNGAFHSVQLPALPTELFWHSSAVNIDGTLSVGVTPDSYAAFAAHYGLTTPPGGDQDKDGIANLLEYALGRNPRSQDTGEPGLPHYFQTDADDLFSFAMPDLSAPDLELQIQSGPDLLEWEILATRTAGGPWTGSFPPDLAPATPGMETVTLIHPRQGDPIRFYRLFVRLVP